MANLHLWTDASCYPNPGPAGCAAIITDGKKEVIVTDKFIYSSINVVELHAIKIGLAHLKTPCVVTVHSDSLNAIRWLTGKQKIEKPWIQLKCIEIRKVIAQGEHTVSYEHVDGHSGIELNERCDQLALEQRQLATEEWNGRKEASREEREAHLKKVKPCQPRQLQPFRD